MIPRSIAATTLALVLAMPLWSNQALAASTAPAGTTLHMTLASDLNSKSAYAGQPVSFHVVAPYPATGLQGATVYGHVISAQKAGQGRNPSIELEVDGIRFANGSKSKLSASIAKIQAKHLNVVAGAAGAGAGMLLGNWIGKSIGIKNGGLFGAAAGFLLASNNKQNIALPAGSQVSAVLSGPLVVP